MAAGLNMVQIIGSVGRDPEMKYTGQGTAVAQFSVAVNGYAKQGQEPSVEWFNVVAWDKLADTCNQLVTRGRLVYIQGRLQTRSWEGQDGQKKYRTEVVMNSMQLLDKKPNVAPAAGWGDNDPDVDIPF